MRLHGVEMDADAALVRRESPEGRVESVALFGADASLTVDGVVFRASGAAEAVRDGKSWRIEGEGRVTIRA